MEAAAEMIIPMPRTFVDFTLFEAISMPKISPASAEANTIMIFIQNRIKIPMSAYIYLSP